MPPRRDDWDWGAIKAYFKEHGWTKTKEHFRCSSDTVAKAIGHERRPHKHKFDRAIIENPNFSDAAIAAMVGGTVQGVKKARERLSVTQQTVVRLVLSDVELPLVVVGRVYRFLGEDVVDLEGRTGMHEAVPVDSLRKQDREKLLTADR